MNLSSVRILLLPALMAISFQSIHADPISGPVRITEIRPYASPTPVAFITTSEPAVCNAGWFKIALDQPGGKEIYAAALAAVASGKKVKIEQANGSSCQIPVPIQSIIVLG